MMKRICFINYRKAAFHMLEFRIKEYGSISTMTDVTQYSLEFAFERISNGTYNLCDYRVRGFFNHHYPLTILNDNGYYAIKDIQPFNGVGGLMTEGYDDWMNDVRPPRIDDNKFASEVILYLPDLTLDEANYVAEEGRFSLSGIWMGNNKVGRYNDIVESYSFIGINNALRINPMNWIVEKRDNVKSRSISSISSLGNIVTVTTSTAHLYNTGDAVRISDIATGARVFGNPGERYEGTFKINVTGANTFTYITKHIANAVTHSTGTVEVWEVIIYETSINEIEGDGNGLITINTSRFHDVQVGDVISIEGTVNYNTSQVIVTGRITPNSIQCKIIDNISNVSESVGSIKYSPRPPSDAIAVNYIRGYNSRVMSDHTLFTYLKYADKDTYIDSNVSNDFGSSTQLRVRNTPLMQRTAIRFPVNELPLSDVRFTEINVLSESGNDGTLVLYQMKNDYWSDSDAWNVINPLIDIGDPIGVYNFSNMGNIDNNVYTTFDISVDIVSLWLSRNKPSAIAVTKTHESNSSDSIYWSTDTDEYKPYIIMSSGVVADIYPPTIQITDSNNVLFLSTVEGDGSGIITLTSILPNNLHSGDIVNLISNNYNIHSAAVLGGINSPNTYTYKINILGNTSTVVDIGGISTRQNVIDVSVLCIDDTGISADINDIHIQQTSNNINNISSTITKATSSSIEFNFTLRSLYDGIYSVSVNDIAGNKSDILRPPLLMYYIDEITHLPNTVRSGSVIEIIGYNIKSPLDIIIGDSNVCNGVINGGVTQSIGLGDIDVNNNFITCTIPSNVQTESNVLSVNHLTNTILIQNASFKVNDIISFNSIGNFMNTPLIVGDLYFIVASNNIGYDVEIQVSYQLGGYPIELDVPGMYMNMVVYNYTTPVYVINDEINSSYYNNFVSVVIDNYPPKIYVPDIIGTGDNIDVIITDTKAIDQSSVSFLNGVATLTDDIDPRILTYNVDITGVGTFRVDVADVLNNSSFVTKLIPAINSPYIEIVNYTINDVNNFVLNVHVIDDNIDAIIAPDNSSVGIFVEGSIANVSYGVITNLTSVSDGLTFDITVSGLLDGVMKIYANTNDGDSAILIPPVLTSISDPYFKYDTVLSVTGINLNHDTNIRRFLNSNMTIRSSTMTEMTVHYSRGDIDGYIDFTFILGSDGNTLCSNTITRIVDNTPPIISVTGKQSIELIKGGVYIEEGVIAIDNIFGDVSNSLVIEGNVDTNTYGTYYIIYRVNDPCGNEAVAIRQVNIVTGCSLYIDAFPKQGYIGDVITITARSGLFNIIPIDNIVTFNNIVATVIGGDRNSIQVVIPFGAISGYIQVETGSSNTGYNECSLSNVDRFKVLYEDEEFDPDRDKLMRDYQKRKQVTTRSGIINTFGRGVDTSALYNRDIGYSGFTEITDENSMVQNVYTIIFTRLGERIFNPQFGTNLENYIHSVIDDVSQFQKNVIAEIVRAVKRYERRVIIDEDESFVYFNEDINDIVIVLHIIIPTGTVRVIGVTLKSIKNNEFK